MYLLLSCHNGVVIRIPQDKLHATEQIMNALYLNLKPNFTQIVKSVLQIKRIYQHNHVNNDLDSLLLQFKSVLTEFNISVLNDKNDAILFNVNFNTSLNFKSNEHKQHFIDEWFKANTGRVVFNGTEIHFSSKFFEELVENSREQIKKSKFNNEDELIYSYIVPVISEIDTHVNDEVKHEFTNFIINIEESLGEKP